MIRNEGPKKRLRRWKEVEDEEDELEEDCVEAIVKHSIDVGLEGAGHKRHHILQKPRWSFTATERDIMVRTCVKYNIRPCRRLNSDQKTDKNILLDAMLRELNYIDPNVPGVAILTDEQVERLKMSLWNAMLQQKFQDTLEKSGLPQPSVEVEELVWSRLEQDIETALYQDPRRLFQIITSKMPLTFASHSQSDVPLRLDS